MWATSWWEITISFNSNSTRMYLCFCICVFVFVCLYWFIFVFVYLHCGPIAGTMVGSPFTFIHLNYIPFLPNIYKRCWTSFSGCYIYKPKVKYCIREFRVVGNSWFPLSHSSPTFDSFSFFFAHLSPLSHLPPLPPTTGPLPLYPFTFSPLLWYFIWICPLWNNSVKSNGQTKVAKCWNPVWKDKNVLCLGFQYEVVGGDTNGIFYFLFSTRSSRWSPPARFQNRRKILAVFALALSVFSKTILAVWFPCCFPKPFHFVQGTYRSLFWFSFVFFLIC